MLKVSAAILLAFATLVSGCITNTGARLIERRAQVLEQDVAKALSYDDAMLEFTKAMRPEARLDLRRERAEHFERLLLQELATHGALDAQTAPAIFATLVAFRDEAGRVRGERTEDLQPVVRTRVLPGLEAAGPLLWTTVEAKFTDGQVVDALGTGAAIARHLPPPGHPLQARLAELRSQTSARHRALADEAGDERFGARLLHSRLAVLFGGEPGDVAARSGGSARFRTASRRRGCAAASHGSSRPTSGLLMVNPSG